MKTVVHLSNADPALHEAVVGNVRTLLTDETLAHEVVALVVNGGGIGLLREDSPQREEIEALAVEGVTLEACRNTSEGDDTDEADLLDEVEIVPSRIGEVARLQSEENYAYFKP
jgi:intracellular sulfur oxidation DsrE/DsrF family protein